MCKRKPQLCAAEKKVARCHEKIRNQRKDYLHKLSRRITDQYDIVAVEDIDMKAMGQVLPALVGKVYRIMDTGCSEYAGL